MITKIADNIQILADQVLLQRFAPASVMINEKGDIIYITGRTGKYLEPSAGKANMNIYSMAREGLRHEITGALRKAMKSYEPVLLHHLKIGTNGGSLFVDVTIQRLDTPEALKGMIIIIFHDQPDIEDSKIVSTKGKPRYLSGLEDLKLELQRSNEDLQTLREEMQTSQEELKSTNEELQSTNEELQSTNEELTTSKEEMQSLNEELQTVNIELQSKVADLKLANDDLNNLLNSTEIATLFLDKEMNIRRFTEPMTKIFKLRSTDVGRQFTDQVSDLQYAEIGTHVKQVIKTLITKESVILTNDGRWFRIRIMPYRTLDDHIDGLVLTFTDITTSKLLEEELKTSRNNFIALAENSQNILFRFDVITGMFEYINMICEAISGYSQQDFYNRPELLQNLVHPDYIDFFKTEWEKRLNNDYTDSFDYQIITREKEIKWLSTKCTRIINAEGKTISLVGSSIDITAFKQ